MVSLDLKVKGKTYSEALDLLKTLTDIIQSNDWGVCFEKDVSIVNGGGEASLVIVNNEEEYHGVRVSCCE